MLASTAVMAAMTTSCPALMPDIASEVASPARSGSARITITPTGTIEAAPLPMA